MVGIFSIVRPVFARFGTDRHRLTVAEVEVVCRQRKRGGFQKGKSTEKGKDHASGKQSVALIPKQLLVRGRLPGAVRAFSRFFP